MLTTMAREGKGLTLAQRVLRLGAESLAAVELIAVAVGATDDDALDTIRHAIAEAGSIRAALASGAGFTSPRRRDSGQRWSWRGGPHGKSLPPGRRGPAPRDSAAFLTARVADRPYEVFACLFLDNRHRVPTYEEMFRGTLGGASVHPAKWYAGAWIETLQAKPGNRFRSRAPRGRVD